MAGERLQKALKRYRERYVKATRQEKTQLLDEFCKLGNYHRKHAIRLLSKPAEGDKDMPIRRRGKSYSSAALKAVEEIWKASGYPWSSRLKELLSLWMPWARRHLAGITDDLEREILSISARQMDRRLARKKRRIKKRLYGRTKPGTLLKSQIPIRTDSWGAKTPGFAEIDTVSHSGPNASGEYAWSLNMTDIASGWCETRAVLGKGEENVSAALEEIRRVLPFALREIDSDNGSEFINYHLFSYCRERGIGFTRARPYMKNDNAHVEQKNWTHVRRIFGWERYDSPSVVNAMNDLYAHELRLMMNLFQPSVKLIRRKRVGAKIIRRYAPARTPLDRLLDDRGGNPLPDALARMKDLRERIDPFELSKEIERKLARIETIRSGAIPRERLAAARRTAPPLPPRRSRALQEVCHAR